MASVIDLNQRLELRDAAGSTVAVFLPEATVGEWLAERETLQRQLADLGREVSQLRQKARDMQRLEAERDDYGKALLDLLPPPEVSLTAEDLAEMERTGVTMANILADLDSVVCSGS